MFANGSLFIIYGVYIVKKPKESVIEGGAI